MTISAVLFSSKASGGKELEFCAYEYRSDTLTKPKAELKTLGLRPINAMKWSLQASRKNEGVNDLGAGVAFSTATAAAAAACLGLVVVPVTPKIPS
jgi:hypothetical protein